jgi:hypothetical protein
MIPQFHHSIIPLVSNANQLTVKGGQNGGKA